MKSRTSFSNLTTFKKDITRFAPVWVLYLIGMLMVMLNVLDQAYYDRIGSVIPGVITAFGIVNFLYAGLIGNIQFGDLYNTRMCYSLHTMPQRRESWFLSHLGSALCFSLVPNLLVTAIMVSNLQDYWFLGLYWLLATTIQFVFFYGIAAVSAMLTGNRVAMLLVYLGLNFVSMLAYWGVNTIYLPMVAGVVLDMRPFRLLCPVVQLFHFDYFEFEVKRIPYQFEDMGTIITDTRTFFEYKGFADGWGYLAALAAVGVAALALALLLYRLRHLESAGDFIAFPKLKGAACVIMTLCVAGVFAFVGEEMIGDGYLLWLIVGVIIGFFGSLMLLERRLKVFRVKNLIGFAVLAAVLVSSFLMAEFDVFRITNWTPDAEDVASVTLVDRMLSGTDVDQDELNLSNNLTVKITEEAEIDQIITAHADILDRLNDPLEGKDSHRISFIYEMKDGRRVIRSYRAPANGTNYEIISRFFYTPQSIMGFGDDWDGFVRNVQSIYADGAELPQETYRALLEALRADCEKGAVTSRSKEDMVMSVDLYSMRSDGTYVYRTLCLTKKAENSLALLKTPDMRLGYSDPEKMFKWIEYMEFCGVEVRGEDRLALLEALLLDCKEGHVEFGYGGEYMISYQYINENGNWCYRDVTVSMKAEHTYQWILGFKEGE